VGVVDKAIEDGIGEGGVSDGFVPVLDGELAGDEGGLAAGPVLDDLEEIAAFDLRERDETEVVQDEEPGLLETVEEARPGAIGAGESQFLEESSGTEVAYGQALPTGGLGEGARDEGLARACGPGDEDDLGVTDPVPGSESEEDGAIQPPWRPEVDVLDTGREPEPCLTEESGETAIFAGHRFSLHEEPEAILEGELPDVGDPLLLLEGGGHGIEPEFTKSDEGGFKKHVRGLSSGARSRRDHGCCRAPAGVRG
jgi:hypothetical protein